MAISYNIVLHIVPHASRMRANPALAHLHTSPTERSYMIARLKEFFEFLWLYFKGFKPVEFVRGEDRVSLHACGWRANGTGRMKRAKDAVAYLDAADAEQWKQIYCGMTPFLVSDKGNVKQIDGSPAKLFLANGRYQIQYKPEDARGRGKNGHTHKKRVYRSMLVAMAFLDFKKGDTAHEIHHVNGYRTDDRLANLLVLTHEDHIRLHNMGPCALSTTRDEALSLLATAEPTSGAEAEKKNKRKRKKANKKQQVPVENAGGIDASTRENNGTSASENDNVPTSKNSSVPTPESGKAETAQKNPREAQACEPDACLNESTNTEDGSQVSGGSPKSHKNPDATTVTSSKKKAKNPKPKNQTTDQPIDWTEARAKFESELQSYLGKCAPDPSKKTPSAKQLTQWAKPVYKAYKPFLTCPDAVTQFDTTLAGVRTIAHAEAEWGTTGPAQLQSLLGALLHSLKHSVKLLTAEDNVVRSCMEELLRDEMSKPVYDKTSAKRGMRQCLSVACSRKGAEPSAAQA